MFLVAISGFLPKTCMNFYFMRAICPANLFLRDFVTVKKFGEECAIVTVFCYVLSVRSSCPH
jgi:hypothetical protein